MRALAQIGKGMGDLVPPNVGQVQNLEISTNFYNLWY